MYPADDDDRPKAPPAMLGRLLGQALPPRVAARLVPPGLSRAWRQIAGAALAARARPVCLEEDGVLVVAVSGAAWRQEVTLAGPQLAARLAEAGYRVSGLKAVYARLPDPPPPPPPPRQATPEEEEAIANAVSGVRDPTLRQALARAMRAQITCRRDPDR